MKSIFFIALFSPILFLSAYHLSAQSLADTQWQVLEIPDGNSKKMINIEKDNLFLAFGKKNKFSFNFDVNGCTATYKADESKKRLEIANEVTCTQACCDKISVPYTQVTSYKRKKDKLTLYTKQKQKIVLKLSSTQKEKLKETQD